MDEAPAVPRKSITLRLVKEATGVADEDELLAATTLQLSWLGLTHIDGLELYSHVRDLYLQHNAIRVVENLDVLPQLEFLALGSNRLSDLGDGLSSLRRLEVLDVTDNEIATVRPGQLPRSLRIINMAGNPFAAARGYRTQLLALCPELMCIDGVDVGDEDEGALRGEAGRSFAVAAAALGDTASSAMRAGGALGLAGAQTADDGLSASSFAAEMTARRAGRAAAKVGPSVSSGSYASDGTVGAADGAGALGTSGASGTSDWSRSTGTLGARATPGTGAEESKDRDDVASSGATAAAGAGGGAVSEAEAAYREGMLGRLRARFEAQQVHSDALLAEMTARSAEELDSASTRLRRLQATFAAASAQRDREAAADMELAIAAFKAIGGDTATAVPSKSGALQSAAQRAEGVEAGMTPAH